MTAQLKAGVVAFGLVAAMATGVQAQNFDPEMPSICQGRQPLPFNERYKQNHPQEVEKLTREWEKQQDIQQEANKDFCDKQKKALDDQRKRFAEERAKQEAAMRELAEKRAAEQAEAAKRRAEYERWAATPQGKRQLAADKLLQAYGYFARVQFCYQVRQGYAAIYISEPEYQRSHDAVKAVEKSVLTEQPDLNSTDMWQQAVRQMKNENWYAHNVTCSNARIALYNMSPNPVYQYPKP